jgi:hypothetical protein
VVTLVASHMAGGYFAGRMRRRVAVVNADEATARDGLIGLEVWGLGVPVSVFVPGTAVSTTVATAGAVASGAGAGSVVQATGTLVTGAAKGGITAEAGMAQGDAITSPVDYLNRTLHHPDTVGTLPASPATMADGTAALLATRTARSDAEKGQADAKVACVALAADAEAAAIKAIAAAQLSAVLSAFLLASDVMMAAAAAHVGAVRGGRHCDEGRVFGGFAYRG